MSVQRQGVRELGLELAGPTRDAAAQDLLLDSYRALGLDPARPAADGTAPMAEHLARLLTEARLVTLVGPGGVGKTRLALEVARAGSAVLAFGACLVELAPVGDPAGVRAAIASALALPDPGRLAEVIAEVTR